MQSEIVATRAQIRAAGGGSGVWDSSKRLGPGKAQVRRSIGWQVSMQSCKRGRREIYAHIANDAGVNANVGFRGLEELEQKLVGGGVFVASLSGFAEWGSEGSGDDD